METNITEELLKKRHSIMHIVSDCPNLTFNTQRASPPVVTKDTNVISYPKSNLKIDDIDKPQPASTRRIKKNLMCN